VCHLERSRNPSEAKGKPPKRFGSHGTGHVTFNFLIKLIFSQREKIFLNFQLSTFNFPFFQHPFPTVFNSLGFGFHHPENPDGKLLARPFFYDKIKTFRSFPQPVENPC